VHREIGIFDNFVEMSYFETLNDHFNITVDLIREEIRQDFSSYIRMTVESDAEDDESPRSFSSLFIDLVFAWGSSSLKKLKLLSKDERLVLIVAVVQNEKCSIRRAATMFEVNRIIIKRRLKRKRSRSEYEVARQLLSVNEETAILCFIDDFIALGFSSRLSMIEEKAFLFLRHRGVVVSLGAH
jgi:hypothetical protein